MTKAEIRQKVWQTIQREGAARFPGAVGRVPNFAGAELAAQLLREMAVWRRALVVKVNPDAPQLHVRRLALAEGKILYMAVPRLRTEKCFVEIDPQRLGKRAVLAASISGACRWGRAVSPREMRPVDLVVCGSVAVGRDGARLGKGGGYCDLEYGLLREEGKVRESTPILTTIHALQLVAERITMLPHDLPVDFLVTPSEVVATRPAHPRPRGIYWDLLRPLKINAIPLLRKRLKRGGTSTTSPAASKTRVRLLDLVWVLFLVSALLPMLQRRRLEMRRVLFLRSWERRTKHRLIALIHRQETMSLLGFPLVRYIDIQDSEEVLRALRLTADDIPIDIILHTPGGLALAAEQIAHAICARKSKVTVYVPHYAMSGGTLIALAADTIVMDANAVLGSLDPQLGPHPAASIVHALDWKIEHKQEIDDETVILADVARKAMAQLRDCVRQTLLSNGVSVEKADELASILTRGEWTHDHPLSVETLRGLGLPINTDMPHEIEEYMRLYPQPSTGRPSVQYIPLPYRSPGAPRPGPRTGGGS